MERTAPNMPIVGPRQVGRSDLMRAGRAEHIALSFAEHFLGGERFDRWLGPLRDRNRRRMAQVLDGFTRNAVTPLPEVRFSTHEEFYRNHHPRWAPVVFRGAARNWPAVGKWTLDFFRDSYRETKTVLIDQHGLYSEGETGRYEVLQMGDLIRNIQAGQRRCLRFSSIVDDNPELRDDLDISWLDGFRSRFSLRAFPQFFLAPRSTFTPIHCALESNAFVQIYGQKRWLLYPAMYRQLFDAPVDRRPYFHTGFLPGQNPEHYPVGDYAPAWEVVLDPGDVLYFGPFVWHYVENITDTIAVAYRFFSLRDAFSSSLSMTGLKFLATRPSLLHTLVCPRRSLNRRCSVPECPFAMEAAMRDLTAPG